MTTGMAILMLLTGVAAAADSLSVTGGNCEQRTCPLGIDVPDPRLAWTLKSARRGERQTAYQILAARDPALLAAGQPDLWDSGKVASESSLGIVYAGKTLTAGQRVWWQVRVWDRGGQPGPYGQPQWWEMALLAPTDWHGKWLTDGRPLPEKEADFYAPAPAPLLRKSFQATSQIKRARIYISGLGYHELRLNGCKVGDSWLDPGWTAYDKRVLYATHDVTPMLREGDNTLGIMLGNGWFNPLPLRLWGHLNLRKHLAVGRPRVIVQLNIDYADGTSAQVVTDETWRCAEGPITSNSIYLGEVYDARKELAGWDTPGFDDHTWQAPAIETAPLGVLRAQSQPPVRVTEEIAAIKVSEPSPGVFVYDFGQNFTGLVRLRCQAAAGTQLVMRYGELVRPDGSLNPMTSVCGQIKSGPGKNVGGPGAPPVAWQTDTYIAKGGTEETYTPRFTFHGFRYLELTGLPAAPPLAAITGLRLHSDVASASSFSCSNERFNSIQQMCRRTFVSNLISVQSDCPHRERLGYGGDIVATSEALMYNFDMATFYQKSVRDWADSVRPDGMLTDTAPFAGIDYCGVGWAMAHPLLVSQLYRYHGDRRLLEEQYAIARRWLLLVAAQNPGGIISKGLGDHESLVPAPVPPLVTPLYYQSAKILAEMARILGRSEDVTHFNELAEHIRQAYQRELLDPKSGVAGPGSQACQAIALYSGLVPEALLAPAVGHLVDDISGPRKNHLSTGIAGTKFLLDALSTHGRADLAYTIANQADFPGWGWMLDNGATTLWEHWAGSDNTFSNNHPMFGSISQWFFNCPGGIRPADDAVGFNKITIAPQPLGDLQWVKATYQSARGPVTSEWKKDGQRFILHVEVPCGANAKIFVPATEAASVTEGGKPAGTAEGVTFLRMEQGAAVFAVGGGSYEFISH
ncbi:MAG: family 78 glycoside hydrolase catalytic domain [Verrucomicrobiota bacterium]